MILLNLIGCPLLSFCRGYGKRGGKQIDKALLNTNHMYGSIKGIVGSAIQSVPLLELPSGDDTESS